jgi:hypothetical protein
MHPVGNTTIFAASPPYLSLSLLPSYRKILKFLLTKVPITSISLGPFRFFPQEIREKRYGTGQR